MSKKLSDVRLVMSGAGAAGTAILRVLLAAGAQDVVVADVDGVIHPGRPGLSPELRWIAEHTNKAQYAGDLRGAVAGADVFVGVSAPNVLTGDDIATMAPDAVVFALANPDPEVDPSAAREHATVVATGRSDYPNQINNVLAFPGVFRGLLDAHSKEVRDSMLIAAAHAIASVVTDEELNPNYIVPSVFHPDVHHAVATAVQKAVAAAGVSAGSHRRTGRAGDGLSSLVLRRVLFGAACAAQLFVLYWPGSPGPGLFPYSDKVVHVAVFGLVAFLGRWLGLRAFWLGAVLVAHAVLSEIVQATLLPARSGDPLDVVADVLGVAVGLAIGTAISGRSVGEEGADAGS